MSAIHTFNTGRRYTSAGQRIAWTIIGTGTDTVLDLPFFVVAFADHDRQIDASVEILDEPTNAEVLRAYDDMRARGWIEDRALVAKLYEAAAATEVRS